jgi:hypothetical protein
MSSRPLRWLPVLLLTFVLGGHWGVLQSIAWMSMMANYSRTAPFEQALARTFDGKHPCPLCRLVANGKKSEERQDKQKLVIKIDFFSSSCRDVIYPPPLQFEPQHADGMRDRIADSPPIPPPRFLRG